MVFDKYSNSQQEADKISSNYENISVYSGSDIIENDKSLQSISEKVKGVRISGLGSIEILEILNKIFNNTSDILLIVDSDGLLHEIMSGAEDNLSQKPEYFVGKYLDQLIQVEYYNDFKAAVKKIYIEGEPFIRAKYELQINGKVKLLEIIMFPALEDKIVCVCKEISKKKLLEGKFSLLWDNSFEGMVLCDSEGNLIDVNDAYLSISGLTREKVVGKCLWNVIEINDQLKNQIIENYRNSFTSPGRVHASHKRIKFISAKIVDIEESHSFMEISPGHLIMFAIFMDITSRVQNEDYQNDLNRFALLGKFSSILSHEIRNSLCKMKMNLDVYKEDFENNGNLGKVYHTFQNEIASLSKLSNEITQFSRHTEIIPIKINIFMFFERIREKVLKKLNDKGIKLKNNTLDNSIMGDYTKLQTAFLSLINNSIDSIEKDGIIEITSELLNDTGKLSVIIKDNRNSIADTDQIFKPSYTNKISDSGLSLLISKEIITEHGGSIKLLSSVKGDTRFEVQLSCDLNG